jgi:prolyl-tRNA editing enzyme YbaK/EbsC (Cys-tRNA(Pro) deacylase)
MTESLSHSAQKVQQALREAGMEVRIQELPASTRTAREAAAAIGCTVAEIAKSLVFSNLSTEEPLLVIASGVNRVDMERLSAQVGAPAAMADADYVREQTGFVIGGVPPIGHSREIETYIDEDLLKYDVIWAAAGTPYAVFQAKANDLVRVTGGEVIAIH